MQIWEGVTARRWPARVRLDRDASGGCGTKEEFLKAATWNQLGIRSLSIVLLDVNYFYDGLLGWTEKTVDGGFVSPGNASIYFISQKTAEEAIEAGIEDFKGLRITT